MAGYFSVFDSPTLIDTACEGRFLETVRRGAFATAFAERGSSIKVQFEHGSSSSIGSMPIAKISTLLEDERGAYIEADMLDGAPPLLVDGLRRGVYGASFRFKARGERWRDPTVATAANPDCLPERDLLDVDLLEAGPVAWGAYPDANLGIN